MQAQNRTVLLAHTQFLLVLFNSFLHLKKPKGQNVVLLLIIIEEKGQKTHKNIMMYTLRRALRTVASWQHGCDNSITRASSISLSVVVSTLIK